MNITKDRAKAVAWGLRMTEGTPIAASDYERRLLGAFVQGTLTIDQVLERLAEPEVGGLRSNRGEWPPAGRRPV